MNQEKDYVLGTHDEEIERLALQHRIWRAQALKGWRQAGFTVGQTILDVGCGPGYATVDLAEIVGPTGRVVALDRSRRFLDSLQARRVLLGLENIQAREQDLDEAELPDVQADGAWVRWVFAFVRRPRALLSRIAGALRPGGSVVIHEYFDYSTWRAAPRSSLFEEFVRVVMQSWRDHGGEPDIALELPAWLEASGFEIQALEPILHIMRPTSYLWQWPKAFLGTNLGRMVELGYLTPEKARAIGEEFLAFERDPHARLITPGVLEIVARKR